MLVMTSGPPPSWNRMVTATPGDSSGISPPRPRSPSSYHHLASNSISYTTLHFHFSLQQRLARRPRQPRDAQRCSADLPSLVEDSSSGVTGGPDIDAWLARWRWSIWPNEDLVHSFSTCEAFRARIIPATTACRHVRILGSYYDTYNGGGAIPHLAETRFTTTPDPFSRPPRLDLGLDLAKSSRVSLRRAPAQAL